MTKIIYKDYQGNSKTIEVDKGLSVMEGAIQNDIPGIDADCGGAMACSTCHVIIHKDWLAKLPKPCIDEREMLSLLPDYTENSRLGCQIVITDKLEGLKFSLPKDI